MRRGQPSVVYQPGLASILGRPTCFACYRPQSHCVCDLAQPFRAHCNILILQHPHERRKYHSTTKLLTRAVVNSTLLRGIEFDSDALTRMLANQRAFLLYPGAAARDCGDVRLDERSTVIAIDGTWVEARKIVFRNPFLRALPRLTFRTPIRSEYRIRKQPKLGCLSTLESVGHLLKQSAAASGCEQAVAAYDSLFTGFSRMIDRQLQHWPRRLAE